jgi:hypothetical protein
MYSSTLFLDLCTGRDQAPVGHENKRSRSELGSPVKRKVSKWRFLYQRDTAGRDTAGRDTAGRDKTYPDSFLSSAHSVSNFGGTRARRRVRADAGGGCSSASASSLPLR